MLHTRKMALSLVKEASYLSTKYFRNNHFLLVAGNNFCQVRYKNHRQLPQKKKVNVFVKRHTDFIKNLCIELVKHERVFTTISKAKQLQEYGDLLITLTQRRQPPPDLFMIKDGFVITEDEAIERRIRKRIVNRRSKRIFMPPKQLEETEFVAKCKNVVRDILLEDEVALAQLYGTLAERFRGRYGGFTKVTPIPLPKKRLFPGLAYVEYVENDLKPLPEMPTIVKGRIRAFPRSGISLNETDVLRQ